MEPRRGDHRIPTKWWPLFLFALIAVVVFVTATSFLGTFRSSLPVTLTSDRSGLVLETGAKVKLRGVDVGRVRRIEGGGGCGDGFLKARTGSRGRCGESDARWALMLSFVLFDEQGQQACRSGGLAGAGATREHRGPPAGGRVCRRALLVVSRVGEDAQHTGVEGGCVDLGRALSDASPQISSDLRLLAPIAIEVEQRALHPQHSLGDHPARPHCRHPRSRVGPGQVVGGRNRRVSPGGAALELDRCARDGGQVDAHGSTAKRPDGEGDREQDPLVLVACLGGERRGHVDVGRTQDATAVECGEQSPRRRSSATVVQPHDVGDLTHDRTPARRSDSATTMAAGGCHEKTPAGCPSYVGVSGPHMPRR